MRRNRLAAIAALALMVAVSGAVVAQDGQGQGGRRQDGQGEERGQLTLEEARQRLMDDMKERLGAGEEEWKALESKVRAVMEAQQELRGGRQGGFGGDQSTVAISARELRSALEDEATGDEVIAERLEAYRGARREAEAKLQSAREGLKGLLTQRQEAMLVMMGLLE
jgi:hypothetical protein